MAPHRAALRPLKIDFNGSGDQTVIAATAGSPLNIYAFFYTVDGATDVIYKDSAGVQLSGTIKLTGLGSNQTLPISDEPWYFTLPGGAFVINSSNAVTFGGTIWYTIG